VLDDVDSINPRHFLFDHHLSERIEFKTDIEVWTLLGIELVTEYFQLLVHFDLRLKLILAYVQNLKGNKLF
jgi:hypothetical protein